MSDDWDFYMLRVDDKPASIMVDLGIQNSTPLSSHPIMGYLRVFMKHANENGLSTDREFPVLCEIGDAVDAIMKESNGQHLYVGRNTSNFKRDFFFYTNDLTALDNALNGIREKFSHYEIETGGRDDETWNVYNGFLHPNPHDMQRIMNRRVCDALKRQNDNFDIPREIDHRVYFKHKADLKTFMDFLNEKNFQHTGTGRTKPFIGKHFVDFKRIDYLANIDEIVDEIFSTSQILCGDYDGWGCEVQT